MLNGERDINETIRLDKEREKCKQKIIQRFRADAELRLFHYFGY